MPRMKIHQLETQEACTHEVSPATMLLLNIVPRSDRKSFSQCMFSAVLQRLSSSHENDYHDEKYQVSVVNYTCWLETSQNDVFFCKEVAPLICTVK